MLPPIQDEEEILQRQLQLPEAKPTYIGVFRYATTSDILIILVSAVCAFIAGGLIPLPPIIFGQIAHLFSEIEDGEPVTGHMKHEIVHYTLFVVYIAVVALVTWFVGTAGFIYTGTRIVKAIKMRYLGALLKQNMAIFDEIGPGNLITQLISDTNVIQDGISHKLTLSISALGTLVSTFAVSFALNWKLTFMLIWSFALGFGLLFGGYKIAVRYGGQSLSASSAGGSIVEEALGSIKSTTALGIQNKILRDYDTHLKRAEKAGIILKSLMGLMVSLAIGTGYINVALAFWQGSKMLVHGKTSLMDVVAITLVTKSAAFCVLGVGHNAEVFTSTAAAASRIFRMISRNSPINSTSDEGEIPQNIDGRLEFRHVKHIYPSRPGVVVGDDLNLIFPPGKTTAIVGHSGSGKSSIAHLLQRFYDPVQGQICLDGRDIRDLNVRWLRRHIALVTQEPYLFDTSVMENILYGLTGTKFEDASAETQHDMAVAAAKAACAHDFIVQLPQGYGTRVGSRGSKLSGGQKQRVAIARATVGDPQILVLDEATSALDSNTELKVQSALDGSTKERTTIVIAHRLSAVRNADNIVVLENGKVMEQGTHFELMKRGSTYYNLVQAQVGQIRSTSMEKIREKGDADKISEKTGVMSQVDSSQCSTKGTVSEEKGDKSNGSMTIQPETYDDLHRSSLWSMTKFVAKLNSKEWAWVLVGLLCSIVAGLEESASAIFFGEAIVAFSHPGDTASKIISKSGFWSGMLLMLGLVMILVFTSQGFVFAYCSERLVHHARLIALQCILRQDMAFFDKDANSSGALAAFLSTEATDLAGISGSTLGSILIAISTLVSSFIVGLIYGWKFGLVCSAVIPILVACGYLGVWFTGEFERLTDKYNKESASSAGEAISAIHTVAFLTRELDVLKSFRKSLDASKRQSLRANVLSSLSYAMAQALFYACMALGFWYGSTRIIAREYSLLQFIVVYSAVIMGAFSAGLVFSFTPNIGKAQRAAQNFKQLLEKKSRIDPEGTEGIEPDRINGSLEFQDVSFAYPTRPQQPVLRNISFSVASGSHVAFVGETGSGKSTLVSLIERFYDAQSGHILFNDHPISSLNVKRYRQSLGFVNQEPTLYDGSIRDNICAGFDEQQVSDDSIREVCRKAQILDFIESLPDGFSTMVGNRGNKLSGGQKQRLALARALISNPTILLLDEATSAIDSQSETLIQQALDDATKGRTTITIAHRLNTVKNMDRIYVLDQGEIIESGNHDKLMARKGRYYEMYSKSQGIPTSESSKM